MATGMREKTTNVGGVIKRIWYAMTGTTQGAQLLSLDDAGNLEVFNAVINGTATGAAITATGETNKLVKVNDNGTTVLGGTSGMRSGMTATPPRVIISALTNSSVMLNKAYSSIAHQAGILCLGKSRGGAVGTESTTLAGDTLGYLAFEGVSSSNTPVVGATIEGIQYGTAATTQLPTYISIKTSNGISLLESMMINSAGVKIASLAGTGNRAVYSDALGVLTNTSSDVRVKKNIENITNEMNVLDVLKSIRGVTYNWDNTIEGYEGAGEQQEIGVIAQEIEQYIPQVVGENATGYKSVDYAKLVAFLIETNKALLEKVEILESKVV